ncbi:MAG: SRPBCC family protein [Gammaproteobacteria bacterium]|nr:SRPBCC family protein [Gammaproteobacteria bacterium]
MKIVKRLLVVLSVLAILIIAIGVFLPDRAHVERSIIIAASPDKVFPFINNFREFNKWSPWFARDPAMKIVFEGPETGVGSKMSWRSQHAEIGAGSQELITSEPNSRVRTHLDFGRQGTATAEFKLIAQGDATQVTWGFDAEFGWDLIRRYVGLMFDRMIGPDYENGLAKLKSLAETRE